MLIKLTVLILMTNVLYPQSTIPESIKDEVETALSYYPELKNTAINFEFKKNIKKSTMQAQPTASSFLKRKGKRSYNIFISETVKISGEVYYTKDMPKDVLIGWIGHELGHVMDYKNRSNLNLMWFGIKYLLSDNHIATAERSADTYAVQSGMEDYILKTKDFILSQANIDQSYIARIKKYYLSPEEIMEIINQRDANLSKS
ncbi:hypothetical protein SAMN05443431_104233 [Olleya namhaensis]|uniref:Peptidase family M48 n=2 Tax=Olleya namhaensis TaxID=1144750 RepID=A0A1I3NRT1_9FLAO|nr:hypothetical protein SAMN05443431_104233 [Olleya namhaensis]